MRLHHVVEGPADAPAVLLGSSLGATHRLWDRLAAHLAPTRRVVRFDTRGHGGSPVPATPVDVRDLAADVVALADEVGVDRFAYVGISLGGAIGQQLALGHPDRLETLVLCCTAARFGEAATWHERAETVRREGMSPLVEPTRERWFTPAFRTAHPEVVTAVMAELAATPPEGYAACCEALARFDATERLGDIVVPTLVVAGDADPTAGPDAARVLTDGIPGARLVVLPDAAHLANLAQPERLAAAVDDVLPTAQSQS